MKMFSKCFIFSQNKQNLNGIMVPDISKPLTQANWLKLNVNLKTMLLLDPIYGSFNRFDDRTKQEQS